MLKLSELAGRNLRWTKADRGSGGGHVLRDGDETVATLRFRSSWGSFATAESGDGSWTFKRVGFLQTRVTIRASGIEDEIAVFRNHFATETGESLVRFTKIGGLLSWSSTVEVLPAGAASI